MKWYKNLDVLRAKDCDPDQGVQRHNWVRAISVTGYTQRGQNYSDYGIIIVKQRSPHYMAYGYGNLHPGFTTISTAGYPYDKTPRWCMWRESCKPSYPTTNTVLRFHCDATAGQSGSPTWVYRNNKHIIYGVLTKGAKPANKGVRINKSRFNRIEKWISDS